MFLHLSKDDGSVCMNDPFYIQRKTAKSCTFLYNFCRNMSELKEKTYICTERVDR
ncbi:hypothetical protein Rumal_1346 [Ruminococcus albus 7 = DSM 20455]|uniref:Uncharacterized protein n=1 Tax=Ruminococcus albus (strain ATCC 27210 / DSM 20455 / JCM 14654 / NCDO 2250 / 7) TaxID=697329 RepID=E6UEU2_RUMA7|nr:hypothetical protein Rumal_1346 [Ruminococcus albus 7 = DSM 20455]